MPECSPIPSGGTTRRHAIKSLAAALAGLAVSRPFAADAWPARTVRIIVPFAPGGGADTAARVLAEAFSPQLGQTVIVENHPGAGGAIGVTAAVKSRDGHTLLMGSNSLVIAPILNPALPYEAARDFDPIGMATANPLVLVVPASSRFTQINDVVTAARAEAGKLSAGNSGNGTLAHLTAELFALQTSTSLTSVPYKGESALMPDLISGLVSLGFLNLPSVIAHIRSGRLRALAVSGAQGTSDLPGVSTLKSLGYPDFEVQAWAGLLAPKGLPPAGLARLDGALTNALGQEAVQRRFTAAGLTPFPIGRESMQKYLGAEAARWQQVIKTRGIKVDN